MSTVNLEKPRSNSGATLGGSKIGASGTDFFIKVHDGDFDFSTRVEDVTGDTDTSPEFENNGLLYGAFSLRGFMVASQAVGIASLIDATKNPVVAMTFDFGGTRMLTQTVMVRQIRIRQRYDGAYVGVSISGVTTDTNPTEGAAS